MDKMTLADLDTLIECAGRHGIEPGYVLRCHEDNYNELREQLPETIPDGGIDLNYLCVDIHVDRYIQYRNIIIFTSISSD